MCQEVHYHCTAILRGMTSIVVVIRDFGGLCHVLINRPHQRGVRTSVTQSTFHRREQYSLRDRPWSVVW